jgi:hypothetical protein
MRTINQGVWTDGSGYWSNAVKEVRVLALNVPYVNDEGDFGELRVYFDTKTWDINEDGLIYTDRAFLQDLRNLLTGIGLAGDDVDYSEQGMQGDEYVSLDVGKDFVDSYRNCAMAKVFL